MSHERKYAGVSAGGAGSPTTSSCSAWRPPTQDSYLKQEDPEDSTSQKSKQQRTSTTMEGAESDASSGRTGRTRKKADPVKSACVQCQKRKTKCSGKRPVCRFCSDRNLQCSWDIGDGLTRTAGLKRKLQEANKRFDDLNRLVDAMRSGSDQTSSMLLARLRIGDSLEQLLSNIRLDASLPDSGNPRLDPQVIERGENVHGLVSAEYELSLSQEHQFDWPPLASQCQQMPSCENWTSNPSPNSYQQTYQQPFFTTPGFDQSRILLVEE